MNNFDSSDEATSPDLDRTTTERGAFYPKLTVSDQLIAFNKWEYAKIALQVRTTARYGSGRRLLKTQTGGKTKSLHCFTHRQICYRVS
mmetsp:Transcript_33832/g.132902  ORF Transcript_33832/g.132902 Transcript_33832/m.132902 type:complete len:88 (+) Transcript_33832:664-927(+)